MDTMDRDIRRLPTARHTFSVTRVLVLTALVIAAMPCRAVTLSLSGPSDPVHVGDSVAIEVQVAALAGAIVSAYTSPTTYLVGSPNQATVTIADND